MIDELTDFYEFRDNFKEKSEIISKLIYGNIELKKAFITVVIPTYNRCTTLRNTIESVLNQVGFTDYIIIVVDNQCKNNSDTECMIKSLNSDKILYYQNEENIGQIPNWNRGIEIADSEWVILLHDDDMLKNNYFEKITKIIKKNPQIQALGSVSDIHEYEVNNILRSQNTHKMQIKRLIKTRCKDHLSKLKLRDYYFESGYYAPIGCLYKRENVIKLGGFNVEFFPISDWVFHVNYMLKYNFYITSSIITSRGVGINESLIKKCRIGFIENGYLFRRSMLNRRKSIFGEWWIQIVTWYNAKVNYKLEVNDIKNGMLLEKYDTKFYKSIYLIIFRFYNLTKPY